MRNNEVRKLMKGLFFMLILTGALISCKEIDKLTQFNYDYETTFTIPGAIKLDSAIDIPTPELTLDFSDEVASNDSRKDMVEKVNLKKMNLSIVNPSNSDFSFVSSISIFIKAEGLNEIKVAWKENIPNTVGNSIDLETTGVDLKEYLKKDKIQLRVNLKTDELVTSPQEIKVYSLFFVDAKVLGI